MKRRCEHDARDLRGGGRALRSRGRSRLLIHAGIAALMLGDHTAATTATVRAAATTQAGGDGVTVPRPWSSGPTPTPGPVDRGPPRPPHWRPSARRTPAARTTGPVISSGPRDVRRGHRRRGRLPGARRGRPLLRPRPRARPARRAGPVRARLPRPEHRHFATSAARLRALAGFGPGHGHRAIRHIATPHYVEAAVRTGYTRVARVAHADYDHWARTVRSPDDLALSARCRALLASGAEAVEHYRTALDLHASGTRDFETSNAPARSCCSAVRYGGCGTGRRPVTGCTAPSRRSSTSVRRSVRRRRGPNSASWGSPPARCGAPTIPSPASPRSS